MARGEVRFRLVLDSKDFNSGIKAASQEFQGFVSQLAGGAGAIGSVASAMGPVGMAAAAAMGAATLAVGAFAKASIDGAVAAVKFAGEVGNLSLKTGISSDALQVLGLAGRGVGVTMEQTALAIQKMQQAMVKAPEDFKQLGLSVENLKKLAPEKQFETLGKAIQSIQDPAQRTAATIHFFGKSGQDAMKLLSVDIDAVSAQMVRLGNVMDESTRAALHALGDSVDLLSTTWDHLWMNIGGAIAQTPAVRQAIEAVTEALGELSRFIQQNDEAIQDLVAAAITPMADSLVELIRGVTLIVNAMLEWKRVIDDVRNGLRGGWIEAAVKAMTGFSIGGGPKPMATGSISVAPPKFQSGTPSWMDPAHLKKLRDEAAKTAEAIERETKKMEQFWFDFYINNEKRHNEWMQNQERMASDKAKRDAQRFIEAKEEAEKFAEFIRGIQEEMAAEAAAEATARWADSINLVGEALRGVSQILEMFGVRADSVLGQLVEGFAQAAEGALNMMAGLASGNPAQIISGIVGVAKAVKGLSESQNALVRASAMLINIPGGLLGLIFGGGGPTAAERMLHDVRMLQTEFINSMGGLDDLAARAASAGISLQEMWDARTVAEYEAAVLRINEAIGLHETAVEKTKEAMERWGLTAADMGPQFAQGMLHEQFAEIYQDIMLLTAAGADLSQLLGGEMGESINEMVQQAMAAGVALPEFMRPYIQALIDAGLLLDANGNKITDISQLQFTESLEAGVQRLIDKIGDLVDALLGIPPEVETLVKVKVDGEIPTQGGGGQQEPPPEPPIQAAEGFYSPALPEDAFFQLHKGERVEVTPADETPARNMRDGRGGDTQVVVYIGGERLDGVIQRRINAGLLRVNA